MSIDIKYIGMDVHKEVISIALLDSTGKLVMESIMSPLLASGLAANDSYGRPGLLVHECLP